jgi:hypothetical protein
MANVIWDLREAFRGLRKAPALVAICVLSLGLGVGVNLTLFTWLSAMFFDQPTIARPSEVVGIEPGNSNQMSYLNYRDLEDSGIFASVFGHSNRPRAQLERPPVHPDRRAGGRLSRRHSRGIT